MCRFYSRQTGGSLSYFIATERTFRRLDINSYERRAKRKARKRTKAASEAQVEGDVRERLGQALRRSFPRNFFLFAASSTPPLLHPPSTGPVSSQRWKLTLATLHQYARACLPSYRISINPPTPTLVQITGQNLYARPDFRRSVITNDTAVRIRTFSVTSANVGCCKRRDGHDTLFGYEIDAFHRSLLSSRRCIAPFMAVIDPIHDIAVTSSIGLKMTAFTSTLMLFCTG